MQPLTPITIDEKTFLRQHCSLPSLPPLVHRLQECCNDPDTSINEVVDIISGDPALVAQVLKIVNSAYYGLPQEVSKINFAIAFLGLGEISRLVLSLSVIKAVEIPPSSAVKQFWFHSFYTALCTKHIARQIAPHISSEELWSAAILHDIGKLVYLKFFPDHHQALQTYQLEQGSLFAEAEQALELPASSYLGALLCDHWLLPTNIREACAHHSLHDLRELDIDDPAQEQIKLICLGNLVAVLSVEALNKDTKLAIASTVSAVLRYSEQEFLSLMGTIYDLRLTAESFIQQFS